MSISAGGRAILVPLLGLGLALTVAGAKPRAARPVSPAPANPAANQAYSAGHWRDGPQIFEKICSACHTIGVGPELRGRGLPPEAIIAVVRSGSGPMPSFRQTDFSDAELLALAKWIEKSPTPAKPAGRAP